MFCRLLNLFCLQLYHSSQFHRKTDTPLNITMCYEPRSTNHDMEQHGLMHFCTHMQSSNLLYYIFLLHKVLNLHLVVSTCNGGRIDYPRTCMTISSYQLVLFQQTSANLRKHLYLRIYQS